ncbi:uncharacterized protein LOC111340203 [Stylophora pistillata]|uniref:uncharacterized protein LOC111340203 n=1 Tax=Stylophora pistillata TaxID=50429 RepID=UPI000C0498D8|nr:uncharacterized protein LOC111340203 [Stylophora pistillata]
MNEPKLHRKHRSRGKQCSVVACNNFEYLSDGTPSKIHFFKFPTKPSLRNRWCNLIKRQHGRDGFYVKPSTVVCGHHFKENDLCKPPGRTRYRLRPGAEPSIFHSRRVVRG